MALRQAFLRYGLPHTLRLDHDTVFYHTSSASPSPTVLFLWLLAPGIEVHFFRKGRPTRSWSD